MNPRQRDLFLWAWSRRRKPGRAAIALRGLMIGVLGGVLFTLIMSPGAPGGVANYDVAGRLFGAIGEHWRMLLLAVPAFGFIGWMGADRIFVQQERMYQAMLKQGAKPPEQKPVMRLADRGPAIAVGVAFVLIAGFIVTLIVMAGAGAL
ncbi:MAG TPA: hypothetical protein PLS69_01885 [Terricaulis sp.]|nr:hypothetical protein [Terricaulis sp.]HRP11431.1 hypothetical protein [Terricaulis sp.]